MSKKNAKHNDCDTFLKIGVLADGNIKCEGRGDPKTIAVAIAEGMQDNGFMVQSVISGVCAYLHLNGDEQAASRLFASIERIISQTHSSN